MWRFGLIIQCPVYSDMQDGGVKKKMRVALSQTLIQGSQRMEHVCFTLQCHFEVDF